MGAGFDVELTGRENVFLYGAMLGLDRRRVAGLFDAMVDFAGLIQPEVAVQMEADTTYEDTALWAVEKYRPDYLILPAAAFPRLEAGYVTRYCHPERKFLSSNHNFPTGILIYICDR